MSDPNEQDLNQYAIDFLQENDLWDYNRDEPVSLEEHDEGGMFVEYDDNNQYDSVMYEENDDD
jgi:hypothetical protein